jgi:23S rRNA (uridine2552-2'-O)-methyltransferase
MSIDDRYNLFHGGMRLVLDLGASPGSWCQVIRQRCPQSCKIVGVDLLPLRVDVPGVEMVCGDFCDVSVKQKMLSLIQQDSNPGELHSRVDVVTSDMCPNRAGGLMDRQRIAQLDADAIEFSLSVLKVGGHFVCKALGGRSEYDGVYTLAKKQFAAVEEFRPPASRSTSDELFLVCLSRLASPRAPGAERFGLDDWPGARRRRPRKP